MKFKQELSHNLLGKYLKTSRGNCYEIVAVWFSELMNGLTVMGMGESGETFLFELPDTGNTIHEEP